MKKHRKWFDASHVLTMVATKGQWSDREVAKRCDVDHKTVGAQRAELAQAHLGNSPDRNAEPEVRKLTRSTGPRPPRTLPASR